MTHQPKISNGSRARRSWRRRLILFALVICVCSSVEIIGERSINPIGRVNHLCDYLAWKPAADRFATVDIQGRKFVIAYGRMSSWLGLSSGPSAYVFDDTGRLVAWSSDIGDDPNFDKTWNAQHLAGINQQIPRSEVEKLAATQPNG